MKSIKYTLITFLLLNSQLSFSQTAPADTTKGMSVSLDEVVISANKVEETKRTVSQQTQIITAKEIESTQAQSTADLISNSGMVGMQKSQMGGGSAVIRGFEANRIVMMVDGVRMNNIIYRAGHLQNIVTIDNTALDRVEILFGPSSTVYGSDALGGVIHMYTKKPLLSSDGQSKNIKVNAFTRYGAVNEEATGHLDFNIGMKKFASLTSFTYSNFGDLKGGENQNPFYNGSYGERPYYVERINGVDSLVKNSDRYLQKQSAFSQYDLMEKILFQQSEHVSHGLNIQYSNSNDVPRYDRLTDPSATGLSYAQWYYGPQERLMAAYDYNMKNSAAKFQNIHFGVNYQAIEESSHTRRFGSDNLSHRFENVNIIGANLDFNKVTKSHKIRFGLDGQFNTLKSTANKENIVTGVSVPLDTRYPDGDNSMMNVAAYFSHTWQINDKVVLTDGIRAGYEALHSTISDNSFFNLPYTTIDQSNPVFSGSIGLINNPSDDWKLSLMFSTGYRVPNLDDLSKIFESSAGNVIVPNADLKPEQTMNYEAGVTKIFGKKTIWESNLYYTQFKDAIVTDVFKFNGQDSITYDGVLSQVLANQNKREAYLYGFTSSIKSQCSDNFRVAFSLNYTYGRIKTDSMDAPLDHIPPFMMRLALNYTYNNFSTDFFVNFNGWKKLKDYSLGGEDNEQYATPEGMPAWFTANMHFSYKVHKLITLQAGVDNIFDMQYRTFASGINAPGRNVFAALRFHY
ncbi:MAG: TonB-dependent receptor [Bacteroidetes bacterium]|nr:TonB-dependent receptor [Bacteroidota bacterium]